MKSMLKDAGILFVITLVSGLLLGIVYEITKDPIAAQAEEKRIKACQEVFAGAETFDALEEGSVEVANQDLLPAGVNVIYEAKDRDGKLLGYVMDITTYEGYSGDIRFTMGISMDGTINGISLLSIAETPGLGMKAEEVLKPQFANKNVIYFVTTKSGAVTPEEIDAISGATITTNALVNGVNVGIDFFRALTGGDANE